MVPFIPPFMNVQVVTFCMAILGRFKDVVCIFELDENINYKKYKDVAICCAARDD